MLRATLLLLGALRVVAAAPQEFYPFAADQDALSGAADFSALNRPITAADRVFARDGHFFRVGPDLQPNTDDDERVRFFGVNLAFDANFPEPQDAPRIARRLRKLGVNLVRLHHMDSSPDSDPNRARSLLTTGPYPTLNPVAVDRLRVFLDSLKAEGIYVNLNLKVGYNFRPAVDGLPPHPAWPNQSKPLHIIHPRAVELQTEYTRKVIGALDLQDDPVLAMVEIENETSLVRDWQTANLDKNLAGEYREIFERQWNDFLRERYGSTEALRAAWGATEPDGPDILPEKWTLEKGAPSDGVVEATDNGLRAVVTQAGPRLILKKVGFSITPRTPYVAQVDMRVEAPPGVSRTIRIDIKQDVSPWRTMTSRSVTLTGEWQSFRMAFEPDWGMEGIGRFGIMFETLDLPLEIRGWKLYQAGRRGLNEGESVEQATVALVGETDAGTQARTDDYLRFLVFRDKAFLDAMLGAIRESAGVLVPVAGTQMGYGGLLNYDSHDALDYQDNHFYVDHPNFPNVSWDDRDWRIRNSSNVGAGMAPFLNMAIARQAGRPYTVSEFNQAWPNTYAAEIDPTLAAFGAFQDWDSIMHFAYSHNRGWDRNTPSGFDINGDWTKLANIGQAAWLFRSGAVSPGRQRIRIPVTEPMRLQAGREKRNANINAFLAAAAGWEPANGFLHPLELVKDGEGGMPETAAVKPAPPYLSDTGELAYDPAGRLFTINAPLAAGIYGFPAGKVSAGVIDAELASSARGFLALTVSALDGLPLDKSRRILLSLPGSTFRTYPGSDPPRPERLINYGAASDWWTVEPDPNSNKPSGSRSSRDGPVWMERVEAKITLRAGARTISVYPLDGAGARMERIGPASIETVEGGFRIHLQADGQAYTPWYEIILED